MKSYVLQVPNEQKVYIVIADNIPQAVDKLEKQTKVNVLNHGELVDMKLLYRHHNHEVII